MRVAVDCCLQESTWNPYYAALLKNVLAASQAHCITAQFCIWDHLKELNSQAPRRLSNLARLTAYLITSKALPMSALRVRLPVMVTMALVRHTRSGAGETCFIEAGDTIQRVSS